MGSTCCNTRNLENDSEVSRDTQHLPIRNEGCCSDFALCQRTVDSAAFTFKNEDIMQGTFRGLTNGKPISKLDIILYHGEYYLEKGYKLPQGQGKGTFHNFHPVSGVKADTYVYEGQWNSGLPHGEGTLSCTWSIPTSDSGLEEDNHTVTYKGAFKYSKVHGRVTVEREDGLFEGKYRNGKLHKIHQKDDVSSDTNEFDN
ncbi:unnamed protein product [Moneuplotes crassus]|uniref:MORN repeat-containing protein n=1 Tax=Euplotes crassus TaxID=5936 RepID=A0AAD2D2V8_EUPCR|nr:unnamed protein product [Moneuplotes crassus]